jgi:hypothetical protein
MSVRRSIAVLLFACAPALAFAQSGALRVGATVVPSVPATFAQTDFPTPSQATQVTSNRFGGSWFVPGELRTTAAFYRDAMTQRGYRKLVDDTRTDGGRSDAVRLHWERNGERVEIHLQPVLGATPAARMIVVAGKSHAG